MTTRRAAAIARAVALALVVGCLPSCVVNPVPTPDTANAQADPAELRAVPPGNIATADDNGAAEHTDQSANKSNDSNFSNGAGGGTPAGAADGTDPPAAATPDTDGQTGRYGSGDDDPLVDDGVS